MRIAYDAEMDALSIIFKEATVTTRQLAPGISGEYGPANPPPRATKQLAKHYHQKYEKRFIVCKQHNTSYIL